MSSIFNTGTVPTFTKEQKKQRRIAWKPSSTSHALQKSGKAVTVYRAPEAADKVVEPEDKVVE